MIGSIRHPALDRLAPYRTVVEEALHAALPDPTLAPRRLHQAMHYALFGPGKRLRPILTVLTAHGFGISPKRAAPLAAAFEMVHAYSLVHDDLPCMDDDDFRRGRPTLHRRFDEATAVLTGDALLTLAFEVLSEGTRRSKLPADRALLLIGELARATGSRGLVGGQMDDLAAEGLRVSLRRLQEIHRKKTGLLFTACLRAGGIIGGAKSTELAALTRFGDLFGQVFQITDDILDVIGDFATLGKPAGSDRKNDKATYPTVLSLERSRAIARRLVDRACPLVERLGRPRLAPLIDLVRYLPERAA